MTAEDQPQPPAQAQHPLQRQLLFWLGALVVLVVFLLVFSSILLPFVAGMALAYLLDPLADWFERRGFSRLAATLVILLVFLIFFIAVLLLLIPVLVDQTTQFINRLPSLITDLQTMLQPLFDTDLARYLGIDGEALPDQIAGFVGNGTDWLAGLLNSLWSGGRAVIAILSLLVITPVVAFYLLYDWDRMLDGVDRLLPRQHAATIRDLARQMSVAIAGFVRGQSLVVLILGVFYATALAVIGLHFGLIIGLIAGLLSFIPFVGTATGFIVSAGVAAAQWGPQGDWVWVIVTVGIFVAGQVLEGNYLQPKIIGNSIGLHPVWLIFALLAFTALFGFVGTLIAVPTSAMIGVLVRFGIKQYRASAFYGGGAPPEAAAEGEAGAKE